MEPARLLAAGLDLGDVIDALEQGEGGVGGGTLERSGESIPIRGLALIDSLAEVGAIVLSAHDGTALRLHDIARVAEGRELRRGAVTADGQGEAVLGLGFMLVGQNSHDVTTRLRQRLEEARRSLPAGIEVTPVYDRSELVDHVLHTVKKNLLEAALLVIAILFVFMGNLRAGLIVALAIPLSLLFAASAMLRFGIAGSLMSLGAIDFGLVVDSSVILVENSVRRLAEANGARPRWEVIRDAALEVRRPTLFGELIILVVYLPVLALEGIEGKLFRPMALTVVFTLIGSMLCSLTLVPALSVLTLRSGVREGRSRIVESLERGYRPLLRFALARPGVLLALALGALVSACALVPRLGSEFVPRLSEGSIVINTVRLAGVSLEESVRYGTQIERRILDRFPDEVERAWSRTGSAEVATDPMGVELTDLFLTLKPRREWRRARTQQELVREMEQELANLPGMRAIFTQPIEMRVNEMVAGIRADLGVKLFGDDFDLLKAKAAEVEAILREIPGAADVVTEQVTGAPLLSIEVDRAALARHGVDATEVLRVIQALGGVEVGSLQQGERRFPIVVRLDAASREDPLAIGRIQVTTRAHERVPLGELAKIELTEGPSTIFREWARRRVTVQANVRGRDIGGFVQEARAAIGARVVMPAGSWLTYGGQFENLERASKRLAIVIPMSLLLILALLYVSYGRLVDAARVFTGVPFAAIGGVIALWLRGSPFSVSAGVGFVALSGVAVLADMVLVSTIRQRLEEGRPLREAIEEACLRRLRPVLMTALVASGGFLPMALSTGVGAEVQRPLATVVIGGVLSSTLLTLVVLPVLYALLARDGRARS
ncbi:MAG: CusA/CzcA family heavy metal efflux RND transporter [Candidatus Eisenbacteria bacterium]